MPKGNEKCFHHDEWLHDGHLTLPHQQLNGGSMSSLALVNTINVSLALMNGCTMATWSAASTIERGSMSSLALVNTITLHSAIKQQSNTRLIVLVVVVLKRCTSAQADIASMHVAWASSVAFSGMLSKIKKEKRRRSCRRGSKISFGSTLVNSTPFFAKNVSNMSTGFRREYRFQTAVLNASGIV